MMQQLKVTMMMNHCLMAVTVTNLPLPQAPRPPLPRENIALPLFLLLAHLSTSKAVKVLVLPLQHLNTYMRLPLTKQDDSLLTTNPLLT